MGRKESERERGESLQNRESSERSKECAACTFVCVRPPVETEHYSLIRLHVAKE